MKLNVSEELPTGAKTADVLQALRGRMWGEGQAGARLLFWDLEHGVADVEVKASNEDYAVVEVINHRELNRLHWLVGRSADKEDAIFVHPYRGLAGNPTIEELLQQVERRHEGYTRRIQGDVMMAIAVLEVKESRNDPGRGLWLHFGGAKHPLQDYYQYPPEQKSSRLANHVITCPKGIINHIGLVVALGTFDIGHSEHGGVTIEVPKDFVAVLSLQSTGVGQVTTFD